MYTPMWPSCETARERREWARGESERGLEGVCGVVRAIQATRGEAGGGAHARGRRARAPVLLARGRGRLARPAGWAGLLGRWARPGKFLPFSSLFLFSNFLTFVWFNKNTKPFYFLLTIFAGT